METGDGNMMNDEKGVKKTSANINFVATRYNKTNYVDTTTAYT